MSRADASLPEVRQRDIWDSTSGAVVRHLFCLGGHVARPMHGPVVIEHPTTTVVVAAGQVGVIDEFLNTVIRTVGGGEAR